MRVVIFPLTWKQIKSQRAMQSLQPKIKELQRKFKGDRKKLQQETMRLYQEYRINPLASCLPLLLQLPIFISLYYAIRGTPELQDATFLWFTLGQPDPYYILLIVYVASQLASTELMLTPETQSQQKWIMRAMPFVFIIILRNFPSGLFLYWITTNLWTVGRSRYGQVSGQEASDAAGDRSTRRSARRSRFMDAMAAAQERDATRSAAAAGARRPPVSAPSSGKKKRRPPQGAPGRAAAAGATGGRSSSGKGSSHGEPEGRPKKPSRLRERPVAARGQGAASGKPRKRTGTASSGEAPRKRRTSSSEAPRKKQAASGGEKRRKAGWRPQPAAPKKAKGERRQPRVGSGCPDRHARSSGR